MQDVKPFEKLGKFTTFDNDIIDYVLPLCDPNEWKIVCIAVRKTTGWQKKRDVISMRQFLELSGIKSMSTVKDAIDKAVEHGILTKEAHGNSFYYAVNTELALQKIERYRNCNVTETVTENVTETVTERYRNCNENVTETVTTKEKRNILKKQLNKEGEKEFLQALTDIAIENFKNEKQINLALQWRTLYGEERVKKALEYYIASGKDLSQSLARMTGTIANWKDNTPQQVVMSDWSPA